MIGIFLTLFIWSSSFALSKKALLVAPPLFVTGSRMIVAGGILLAVAWFRKSLWCKISFKVVVYILFLALIGFYFANVCEFKGLTTISSSKASFIYGLSPFAAAFFSYVQLKEKVSLKKCLGLSIGFLGYLFYLSVGDSDVLQRNIQWNFGKAEVLILLATVTSAFGWTLLRKIVQITSSSVYVINAIAMLIAGILSLGHSFLTESWSRHLIQDKFVFVQSLIGLIIFSNIISYNLYAKLLKRYSSTFLSFCGLVMPIFSGFYGWIFLGERMSPLLLLSVSFMLIGCKMIYAEEFKQGYIV